MQFQYFFVWLEVIDSMPTSRNYVIEGVLEKAYQIEREIIEDLEIQGYDDNALFSIRLAMDEALINALKHGNHNDSTKTLKISYDADDKRVMISVEDEGNGFDHRNILDPTRGESLRRTHGRGIFLVRQFMHEISFNEKGNRISFAYHREPTRSGEFLGLRWVQRDDVLVFSIVDVIGFPQVDQWEERIRRFVSEGYKKVVFDLGRLDFINTTVLSLLVMIAQTIKTVHGRCSICSPQSHVLKVLKTTNLNRLIPIHPDLETALADLADTAQQSA